MNPIQVFTRIVCMAVLVRLGMHWLADSYVIVGAGAAQDWINVIGSVFMYTMILWALDPKNWMSR